MDACRHRGRVDQALARVDVHIWFKFSLFNCLITVRIMTPKSINMHSNWWFLTSQISHPSKKSETICPESRKRLTTQCKFSIMDVDAKRSGEGKAQYGHLRTMGRGIKNWQNLADVFYGWPLTGLNAITEFEI